MIKQALNDYANRAVVSKFTHDRMTTVGASEIGQCARKVRWIKNRKGLRDEDYVETWGARVRGSTIEEQLWYPALKTKYGKKLLFAGPEQKTLVLKKLSATPDGLLIEQKRNALAHLGVKDIEGTSLLVECKSLDPRANASKVKAENAFQVQVQLGLVRKLTKYKPMYAVISYIDASFWNEVVEFPVRFDPNIFEAAQQRAEIIFSDHDLRPEGWIAGGRECEFCPYTKLCGIVRKSVPAIEKAADPQFVAEITDMCREANQIEAALDRDTEALRSMQQAIKDRLREKSVRKIPGVVVWSYVKGRESYNMKALREAAAKAGVDVEAFSTVGEPTDRLQISSIPEEPSSRR